MTKQELIDTAKTLQQPSTDAASEYAAKHDQMAARINVLMEARPDLTRLIGEDNLEMMRDNHRNHARFISSLLSAYNPEILVETVLWVFRAYRSHGFQMTYWPAQLDTWIHVLREELNHESYNEISPFYHWMIIHQPQFIALSEGHDDKPPPAH